MTTVGRVTWFNDGAGWGNVRLDDGTPYVMVPREAIQRRGMQTLLPGELVLVRLIHTHGGLQAEACLPLGRDAIERARRV